MANNLIDVAADSTRGGFFLLAGTAVATIIMAIGSILVARFLGAELYGQYTLVFVTPQLVLLFTDMGVNQGIIKYTATLRQQGETTRVIKIIKYGVLLKASVAIIIFIITYMFSESFASILLQRPDLTPYVRLASISILFEAVYTTLTSAFVGLDKTEYDALASIVHAASKALISSALIVLGLGVAGAIIGHVASYLISTIASTSLILFELNNLKKNSFQKSQSDSDDLKTLINYGVPLYISVLLIGFIPLYQSVVLAFFATDVDIGNFKAATNFVALMAILTTPITTALLPAFSKLDSATNSGIKHFFKLSNKYTTLVILPITFLIIILSDEIVETVYGSTYQLAPEFLATYCLLYLLTGVGYLTLTSFFNGLGDTKTTLKRSLITFFTVIMLAPPLTQYYKVNGIIASFIVANALSTLYGGYIGIKKLNIQFDRFSILKIYLCSTASAVPTAIFLQLTNLHALVNVVIGGLLYVFTYLTLIPLTKTITFIELKAAALILQKIKPLSLVIKPLLKYQQKILKVINPKI